MNTAYDPAARRPWFAGTGELPADERERLLRRARSVATLMDTRFSVLGIRFGLDPVIGLVPVAGDVIGGLASLYLIWTGYRLGVSGGALARMAAVGLADVGVGLLPLVGDLADAAFKGHRLNLRILEANLGIEREA